MSAVKKYLVHAWVVVQRIISFLYNTAWVISYNFAWLSLWLTVAWYCNVADHSVIQHSALQPRAHTVPFFHFWLAFMALSSFVKIITYYVRALSDVTLSGRSSTCSDQQASAVLLYVLFVIQCIQ